MRDSHGVRYPTYEDPISNRRVCFLELPAGGIFVSGKLVLLLDVGRHTSDVDTM